SDSAGKQSSRRSRLGVEASEGAVTGGAATRIGLRRAALFGKRRGERAPAYYATSAGGVQLPGPVGPDGGRGAVAGAGRGECRSGARGEWAAGACNRGERVRRGWRIANRVDVRRGAV